MDQHQGRGVNLCCKGHLQYGNAAQEWLSASFSLDFGFETPNYKILKRTL